LLTFEDTEATISEKEPKMDTLLLLGIFLDFNGSYYFPYFGYFWVDLAEFNLSRMFMTGGCSAGFTGSAVAVI
jgi:hypothetical protein